MSFNKEDVIKRLVDLRKDLNKILEKKYIILETLQDEIFLMKQKINELDQYLSKNSIMTASELMDTESFLEKSRNKPLDNIDVTRKLYDQENSKVLLMLFKYDGKNVNIYFPNPHITKIKPVSELYLQEIIEPLLKIKETETSLNIKEKSQNEQDYLTKLFITGIYSFENVEQIFELFTKLIQK
ncbi:MAG: hypothetical protein GF364_02275 [Candidatus Lokiarchaeota archaeon]|nr:hypothetical protein [Candidatus Lokiarchaeota archaeon]